MDGSAGVHERLATRAREWCLAHQKKTKDGKWEVDPNKPETARVVNLVMEQLEKEATEKEKGKAPDQEHGIDALTKALGKKDHRGFVKGLGRCGVGVGNTQAFGKATKRGAISGCSVEELEAFKARLTEEFEAKVQERVAAEVQTYLASYTNLKLLSDQPINWSNEVASVHPQPDSNGIHQGKQLRVDIEDLKKCHLAVNDELDLGNLVVVAEGTIQPNNGEIVHNSSMLRDHYRVRIDQISEVCSNNTIDLPVPSPDGMTKVKDARGYIVQWPTSLVLFEDKAPTSPHKKFKESTNNKELVASWDPKAVESCYVRMEEMVGDDVV